MCHVLWKATGSWRYYTHQWMNLLMNPKPKVLFGDTSCQRRRLPENATQSGKPPSGSSPHSLLLGRFPPQQALPPCWFCVWACCCRAETCEAVSQNKPPFRSRVSGIGSQWQESEEDWPESSVQEGINNNCHHKTAQENVALCTWSSLQQPATQQWPLSGQAREATERKKRLGQREKDPHHASPNQQCLHKGEAEQWIITL